jgi:phthalate 4,5-dioxygenase oxygenase subunit
VQAVKDFQQGAPAMGTGDQHIPASVCAFQSVIPKTTDWREYETQPIWKDNPVNPELDTAYSVRT